MASTAIFVGEAAVVGVAGRGVDVDVGADVAVACGGGVRVGVAVASGGVGVLHPAINSATMKHNPQ